MAVKQMLEQLGWTCTLSAGSKGPADIIATRLDMKLAIQVKLRKDTKCTISSSEINRLIKFTAAIGAAPIVAVVTDDLEKLLSTSVYSKHTDYRNFIVDPACNLVCISIGNNQTCFMYNMTTGDKVGFEIVGGANE
jgi:Holliday junction resolvase